MASGSLCLQVLQRWPVAAAMRLQQLAQQVHLGLQRMQQACHILYCIPFSLSICNCQIFLSRLLCMSSCLNEVRLPERGENGYGPHLIGLSCGGIAARGLEGGGGGGGRERLR